MLVDFQFFKTNGCLEAGHISMINGVEVKNDNRYFFQVTYHNYAVQNNQRAGNGRGKKREGNKKRVENKKGGKQRK